MLKQIGTVNPNIFTIFANDAVSNANFKGAKITNIYIHKIS
jgi:hypothetical protein